MMINQGFLHSVSAFAKTGPLSPTPPLKRREIKIRPTALLRRHDSFVKDLLKRLPSTTVAMR
jgi:hypothetical protein